MNRKRRVIEQLVFSSYLDVTISIMLRGVFHLYGNILRGSIGHKHCMPKQFLQFKLWHVFYQ